MVASILLTEDLLDFKINLLQEIKKKKKTIARNKYQNEMAKI